jgi:hypothetical protein
MLTSFRISVRHLIIFMMEHACLLSYPEKNLLSVTREMAANLSLRQLLLGLQYTAESHADH